MEALQDYIGDTYGEDILQHHLVKKHLSDLRKVIRELKNGGVVIGPRRNNLFQNFLNKLFATIFHVLGVADFNTTMKNFVKLRVKKTRL